MKTKILLTISTTFIWLTTLAQCNYIPSTSSSTTVLSYSFTGGSFASYGCAPIDPTYWISGSGKSVNVTFVTPESNPSLRVWGLNDDDIVAVTINNVYYPLTSSSASYDTKVVCGLSPGPNGVTFSGGNLVGVNSNTVGNYSYQNVQLNTLNVSTIKITGLSGNGWGFAGVSVKCAVETGIRQLNSNYTQNVVVYPNPSSSSALIQFNSTITNGELNVYNQFGQKVRTVPNVAGDKLRIDTSELPPGLYSLYLSESNNIILLDKIMVTN